MSAEPGVRSSSLLSRNFSSRRPLATSDREMRRLSTCEETARDRRAMVCHPGAIDNPLKATQIPSNHGRAVAPNHVADRPSHRAVAADGWSRPGLSRPASRRAMTSPPLRKGRPSSLISCCSPNPSFLFFFLPLVLLAYFGLGRSSRDVVLLVSSLIFYAWGEGAMSSSCASRLCSTGPAALDWEGSGQRLGRGAFWSRRSPATCCCWWDSSTPTSSSRT